MAALGTLIVGCTILGPSQAPSYVPEMIGIVSQSLRVGQNQRYELVDGRVLSVPTDMLHVLGGTEPQVDELLLAGSQPDQWVYRAPLMVPTPNGTPAECYRPEGRARANGTHVFMTVHDAARGDVIMVLPKAADWTDNGYLEGTDILLGDRTCVNPRGEALWHR